MVVFSLVVALLPVVQPVPPAQDDDAWRVVHLSLRLATDFAEHRMDGVATLRVVRTGDAPGTAIPIVLNHGMRLRRVTAGGEELPFSQQVTGLAEVPSLPVTAGSVTLPRALPSGDTITIAISYGGALEPLDTLGLPYVHDHVDGAFTLVRSDSRSFPWVASPSIASYRRTATPFRWDAELVVPDSLVIAAAGRMVRERHDPGHSRWLVRSDGEVPYLFLAMGRYRQHRRPGAVVHAFVADSGHGATVVEKIVAVRDTLERWFGRLDGAATVTVIEIPEGWGSQASLAGGIIQTADGLRSTAGLEQLYHEMAHLFHRPDNAPDTPRWSEGFATWVAHRVAAAFGEGGSLAARMTGARDRLRQRAADDSTWLQLPLARFGGRGLTDRSYLLGAVGFDALAEAVGRAEFDAGWRRDFVARQGVGVDLETLLELLVAGSTRGSAAAHDWFRSTDGLRRLVAGPG